LQIRFQPDLNRLFQHLFALIAILIGTNDIRLFSVIFCEAVAIYGIIMAVIFQTKLGETGENVTLKDYYSGFSIFWAGMAVGLTNIICG
jgi:F0F1-type ATP synthase membrane subunit c/vacuolar-type H+-ATPase subunit K